jgi:hypothetical protein
MQMCWQTKRFQPRSSFSIRHHATALEFVMAERASPRWMIVPAIHILNGGEDVDARHEAGHDVEITKRDRSLALAAKCPA